MFFAAIAGGLELEPISAGTVGVNIGDPKQQRLWKNPRRSGSAIRSPIFHRCSSLGASENGGWNILPNAHGGIGKYGKMKIWKGGYFPYFPYFGGSRYGKYPPKNPRKYRNHQIWGISHLQIHHDTPILKPRSSRYTICIGPSPTTWCHVEPLGPTTANPLFRFMVRERLVVDWLGFGQHRVPKKLCILWKKRELSNHNSSLFRTFTLW